MSTVIDQNMRGHIAQPLNSLVPSPAANADHLPASGRSGREASETTGGWDAHEVWRRLIKEARDRRQAKEQLAL